MTSIAPVSHNNIELWAKISRPIQWGGSPSNEVIVDHWKWTKMLTKVFQRNLTSWGYVIPPIKPHPNPPWGKPRLRVKAKMAAIKPEIYVIF